MLQSALAQVGVAVQAAKGTATANPAFAHGVSDGSVLTVDIEQDRADVTSGTRIAPHVDRTGVKAGFEFTSRAHSKSVGLWLYLALGAKSVTGAGPYTHTITPANTLPYATFWGWLDSQIYALRDCMVDELEISWDGTKPPDLKVKGMGTIINFAPTFTPTVDDTKAAYMVPPGGTFKVDVASSTPVAAKITGGSVKIANGLTDRTLSGSVVPEDVFPARQDIECGLKLVPDDLTDWRKAVTGASGGTTAAEATPYGSYEVKFVNGSDSLMVASPRVAFIADFPDASPQGGPVELELSGLVPQAAAGAAVTATLINTQATY